MIILQAQKLNKSFGGQEVFKDVQLSIQERERVGLVGVNGAGKTTLLKCLTGLLAPDGGEITYGSGLTLGYLEQLAEYDDGTTIWDAMLESYAGILEKRRQLHELEAAMADGAGDLDKLMDRYGRLNEAYERADGYACENNARRILSGLGFEADNYQQEARHLSGGQKTRLNLGRLLARKPDLLFLDEPTNHLDIASVEWLEEFVKSYAGTVLVVSHDRRFLDKTATRILDLSWGSLSSYEGNYSQYLIKRAAADLAWQRVYDKQQEYIRETEAYIRRFKAGIKAKQARGRQSQLQRLERIDRPRQDKTLAWRSLDINHESGQEVLRLKEVTKSFGSHKLFKDLDLQIRKGEKIALVGPNGCGKTTLLKIISGRLAEDQGEVRLGSRVETGYYEQEYEELNGQGTVLEEILYSTGLKIEEARTVLGAMLFSEDDVFKPVASLSGGEKGRLALLKLILSGANFLLLDEPTNHLDLDSCQTVENMLQHYEGTVLLVSHDRYFIDQVAEKVITLQDGQLETFNGNYTYYQEKIKERGKAELEVRKQAVREQKRPDLEMRERQKERQRTLRRHTRALEEIEAQIAALEEDKGCMETKLSDPETYSDEESARAVAAAYKELEEKLLAAYREWEQISDLLEAAREAAEMEGNDDEVFAR